MQGDRPSLLTAKKRAVKLGGPHRPLNLPTEGGVFHRKELLGAGFLARPPERAVGGGD